MDVSFISGHYKSISAGHNFRESYLAYCAEQNNLSFSENKFVTNISIASLHTLGCAVLMIQNSHPFGAYKKYFKQLKMIVACKKSEQVMSKMLTL